MCVSLRAYVLRAESLSASACEPMCVGRGPAQMSIVSAHALSTHRRMPTGTGLLASSFVHAAQVMTATVITHINAFKGFNGVIIIYFFVRLLWYNT